MKDCERCHWTTNETCRSCKAEMRLKQEQLDSELGLSRDNGTRQYNELYMSGLQTLGTDTVHARLQSI